MTQLSRRIVALGLCACAVIAWGSPSASATAEAESVQDSAHAAPSKLSFRFKGGTLGSAVRTLGEERGLSLVVMNGIEGRRVGPVSFRGATPAEVAETLALMAGCRVQQCPDYAFVFPPGYDDLQHVALGRRRSGGLQCRRRYHGFRVRYAARHGFRVDKSSSGHHHCR